MRLLNGHYNRDHIMNYMEQKKSLKALRVAIVINGREQTWSIFRQCGYCPKHLTRNNTEYYRRHRGGKEKCFKTPSIWRNPAEAILSDSEWAMMTNWRLRSFKAMSFIMDECVQTGALPMLEKFIREHRKGRKIHLEIGTR